MTYGKSVPDRHGDVPTVCVKVDKEDDLDTSLDVPQGMIISKENLAFLDVESKRELALRLKKGCMALSCLGGYGT
ncbi:Retrotransposon 4 protein [Phytophthora megakarya]|uniref:Retrotransposon 4 protein n=1 Tax=Phytophthora megakarya TaxID=4795 RepID=A0A225UBQ7_9STRA|nr:Retrotransposon 4 protein [Phytophthora megakarya]